MKTTTSYPSFYDPNHFLSPGDGSRHGHRNANVLLSRAVLYDKIGPGKHPCHWCGRIVEWMVGGHRGVKPGQLVADHLDKNPENNSPDNLVPSCQSCNVKRGMANLIQPGEPTVRSRTVHDRVTRAEERICPICGKTFLHMIAKRNPRLGQTCSYSCANKLRWRSGGTIGRKKHIAS